MKMQKFCISKKKTYVLGVLVLFAALFVAAATYLTSQKNTLSSRAAEYTCANQKQCPNGWYCNGDRVPGSQGSFAARYCTQTPSIEGREREIVTNILALYIREVKATYEAASDSELNIDPQKIDSTLARNILYARAAQQFAALMADSSFDARAVLNSTSPITINNSKFYSIDIKKLSVFNSFGGEIKERWWNWTIYYQPPASPGGRGNYIKLFFAKFNEKPTREFIVTQRNIQRLTAIEAIGLKESVPSVPGFPTEDIKVGGVPIQSLDSKVAIKYIIEDGKYEPSQVPLFQNPMAIVYEDVGIDLATVEDGMKLPLTVSLKLRQQASDLMVNLAANGLYPWDTINTNNFVVEDPFVRKFFATTDITQRDLARNAFIQNVMNNGKLVIRAIDFDMSSVVSEEVLTAYSKVRDSVFFSTFLKTDPAIVTLDLMEGSDDNVLLTKVYMTSNTLNNAMKATNLDRLTFQVKLESALEQAFKTPLGSIGEKVSVTVVSDQGLSYTISDFIRPVGHTGGFETTTVSSLVKAESSLMGYIKYGLRVLGRVADIATLYTALYDMVDFGEQALSAPIVSLPNGVCSNYRSPATQPPPISGLPPTESPSNGESSIGCSSITTPQGAHVSARLNIQTVMKDIIRKKKYVASIIATEDRNPGTDNYFPQMVQRMFWFDSKNPDTYKQFKNAVKTMIYTNDNIVIPTPNGGIGVSDSTVQEKKILGDVLGAYALQAEVPFDVEVCLQASICSEQKIFLGNPTEFFYVSATQMGENTPLQRLSLFHLVLGNNKDGAGYRDIQSIKKLGEATYDGKSVEISQLYPEVLKATYMKTPTTVRQGICTLGRVSGNSNEIAVECDIK